MNPPLGPRRVRAEHRALSSLAALLVALTLSSCSASGRSLATGLPSLTSGCNSIAAGGSKAIPFSETAAGAGELAWLAVCVNGSGPYRFLLSTGTGESAISPAVARSLHLRVASTQATVRGVSCTAITAEVTVRTWSVGGVRLAPQNLLVATVPNLGTRSQVVDGVVGSDVLGRFGAIGIDYKSKKLVVARAEAPAPSGNVIILGQSASTPPAGLLGGFDVAKVGATLRVLESTSGTQIATPVSFGSRDEQFAVDSGSVSSSVNASLVSALQLNASGRAGKSGLGCSGSSQAVASGSWTLGGSALPHLTLVSQDYAGVNQSIGGALGSDVLSSYGAAILDYQGAHLWLGAG